MYIYSVGQTTKWTVTYARLMASYWLYKVIISHMQIYTLQRFIYMYKGVFKYLCLGQH